MGCGGEELTCELLADPNNCWARAASDAAACLASRATPGTLAPDRTTCTWPDGSRVVFDEALPMDTQELDHLSFEATGNGCSWSFTDTFMNRMILTVGGRTVTSTLHPDREFELVCDDGTSYEAGFDVLFTCTGEARAPTDGFEVDANGISFTISAVGVSSPLFTCEL
jgi:hypothetical protein